MRTTPRLNSLRWLAAAIALCAPLALRAAPSHVQAAANEVASGSLASTSFASANAAGNLVVAFVIWNNAGSATVSDTNGNAYAAATPRVAWGSGGAWSAQTFYARNVLSGANTVRATFSTPVSSWGTLHVHEYSGIDRTAPLDVTRSAVGTSAAMSSGSATTSNASDLIFGAAASNQTVNSAGSGFTTRSTAFGNRIEDRNVTSAGAYAATARQNGSRWVMQLVAFKAATGDATPPSQPTALTASVVSGSRIDLAWTASTDNVGVTGYRLFRNGTLIAAPTAPAYSDSGLTPGTTYSYSVSAIDAAGNVSAPSATVSATTTPIPDTTPPSQPTGLVANVVSGSQINLTWTASTDNVGVIAYLVTRNGSQVGTPTATAFNDTGLVPATTYAYTVSAVDAAGNVSLASGAVSATTRSGVDTNPPTVAIATPAAGSNVADIVVVTAAASDDVGVVGVQFYIDGAPVGVEDATAPYTYSWDTRGTPNGVRSLVAQARDAAGNFATSAAVAVNVANVSGFQNEILATGLSLPTSLKFLADGRMLVAELTGAIKVFRPPYLTADPAPFLLLQNVGNVGYAGLQQGIFDFALDPNFATNHFYYVFYTMRSPNRDRLSRFTANASLDGTDLATEVVLYQDPQDANTEHHGGAVMFGNDGKLYFTTGEHFQGTPAQDLASPRGKLHRINADGSVPTDNPFYDGTGPNVDSIWARGLRNPYRGSVDPQTGRMYIGDVGGNDAATAQEEVDEGVRGANYGWPNNEGPCSGQCTSPIHSYPHNGRDASVTGGFVYRGSQFPASHRGNYFFADYAQNSTLPMTFDTAGTPTGVFNFEPIDGASDGPYGDIVYLTEGPDGALYYLDLGYSDTSGTFGVSKVRRIRYNSANLAPTSVSSATPQGGPPPLTVSFSSAGSTDPEGQPLTYSWNFGDGSTSASANPSHTYNLAGPYTVRLTVSDGVSATVGPPLAISVGQLPVPAILTPADASTFVAGDSISFSGDATDPVDGPLPASAFTWTIDFLHDGHVHPGAAQSGIKSGVLTIPTSGHDFSGNTRYRITLSVVNSSGLTATRSIVVSPVKVNLSFTSVPSGLSLFLDGIARVTPFVYDTVPNFVHSIEARDQTSGSTTYRFASWSDGGAQLHTISVPSSPQTYAATYNTQIVATPPTFVQVAAATPQTNQTSVSVTYPAAQTAGNLNVLAIGWNASSGTVSSVVDSAGNVYQQAVPPTFGSGVSQALWIAKNIAARAAGANTVTVTFSASMPFVDLRAAEYGGIDPVTPIDAIASAAGTSNAASSGLATTTFPSTLLFGAGTTTGSFTGATGGATTRIITTPDADVAQDRVVTAPGAYAATASLSGSSAWVMQLLALRAASTSGTPDTSAPSQPTGLSAQPVSASQIDLSWSPSIDDVAVTGYRVFRNGTQVGVVTGTAFSDVGLTSSTTYGYFVSAFDAAGNTSPSSATVSATTGAVAATAPSFVQLVAATPQTNQTAVSVTFPGAQSAGDLNIVAIGWNASSGSIAAVTDSAGNLYQQAAPPTFGSGVSQSIWTAKNIASRAAGTNTLTVTFSAATPFVDVRALEYRGIDPANPVESTASASGTSTAASSGLATATSANELLFGAGMTTGSFTAATGGATTRVITTPDADIAQDQLTASAGAYAATANLSGSSAWVMQLVVLRPVAIAPAAVTSTPSIAAASATRTSISAPSSPSTGAGASAWIGGDSGGDLDGDGLGDALAFDSAHGVLAAWLVNGAGSGAWKRLGRSPGADFLAVGYADADGDGQADVLWRNDRTASNVLWRMKGTRHAVIRLPSGPAGSRVAAFADFTGDGRADIFFHDSRSGASEIWTLSGDGRTGVVRQASAPPGMRLEAVADIDGDSTPDLVWRSPKSDAVEAWLLRGSSPAASLELSDATPRARVVASGDLDGDGTDDLVWSSSEGEGRRVEVWFSRRQAAPERGIAAMLDRRSLLLGVADVTADGRSELLISNPDGLSALRVLSGAESGARGGAHWWVERIGGLDAPPAGIWQFLDLK